MWTWCSRGRSYPGGPAGGYFRGNLEATRNLLQACQEYGPEDQKILFVSSLAAAGPSSGDPLTEDLEPRPVSAYGESKLAAERAVLEFGRTRPVIVIRPPAVYGPRDRDTFMLFKSVQKGAACHSGPGQPKGEPGARARSGDGDLAGRAVGAGQRPGLLYLRRRAL